MATNNAINQHRPSGFSAYLSASTADNVTGDNTDYTILCDTTLITDGNYNTGTGTYTAPATGRFLISGAVMLNNIVAQTYIQVAVVATGVTYYPYTMAAATPSTGTQLRLPYSVLIQMTAGDTCQLHVVLGGSTKTVGVVGSAAPYSTWFSCYQVG